MRESVLTWAASCIAAIEKSDVPTWVMGGDMNVAIGEPKFMQRKTEVDGVNSIFQRRFIAFCKKHGVTTAHGTNPGEIALFTSVAGSGIGQGEPDHLLVKPYYSYVTVDEPIPPQTSTHRNLSIILEVLPPLAEAELPIGRPPRIYTRPPYSDMEAWTKLSRRYDGWVFAKKEALISNSTSAEELLDFFNKQILDDLVACFHEEPVFGTASVKREYKHAPITPEISRMLVKARNLKHQASNAARSGDSSRAATLRKLSQETRAAAAAAAMSAREKSLYSNLAKLAKSDSHGFFSILGPATSDSTGQAPIPPGADGVLAEDSFPLKAKKLFHEDRRYVPATEPGSPAQTFWGQYYPKLPPGHTPLAIGEPATRAEVYNIIRGFTLMFPPRSCHPHCSLCALEIVQFEEHKAGRAPRLPVPLATSKAAGDDDLCAEALAWIRVSSNNPDPRAPLPHNDTLIALVDIVVAFFNKILESGSVPPALTSAKIIPLLKPGKPGTIVDKSDFDSYRLLTLRNLMDKIVQLILTRRLTHFVNLHGILPVEQSGFTNNLSTEHSHFFLLHAIKRLGGPQHPVYSLFGDIARAYDNLHHSIIVSCLQSMEVPMAFTRLVYSLLTTSVGRLLVNGTLSDPITISKGLGQGTGLAPLLWNICATPLSNYINSIPTLGVTILRTTVNISLYADDTVGVNSSEARTASLASHMHSWGEAHGLNLNMKVGKTSYTKHDGTLTPRRKSPPPPIPAYGTGPIPGVNAYHYLGVDYDNDADIGHALRTLQNRVLHAHFSQRIRSTIIPQLPPAHQLQLLKTYTGSYMEAFAPMRPDDIDHGGQGRWSALRLIFRLPKSMSSLLPFVLSGLITEKGSRLQARYRLDRSLMHHPHLTRNGADGAPLPVGVAVSLYRDLREELNDTSPASPFNWIKETADLLCPLSSVLPRNLDGSLAVPIYPFQVHQHSKTFGTAVSYIDFRMQLRTERRNPLFLRNAYIFIERPSSDGPLKHAGFITAYLTAPDSELSHFNGVGMGTLGPGCRHPQSIDNLPNSHHPTLTGAQKGNGCLNESPWNGAAQVILTDPEDDGDFTSPMKREAYSKECREYHKWKSCPLCNSQWDSVYHIAMECTHLSMVTTRYDLFKSMAGHISSLAHDLQTARRRAGPCALPPTLTPQEETSLEYASLLASLLTPGAGSATSHAEAASQEFQARIFGYRLLIAAPWSARNVAPRHIFATALGKIFDSMRARVVDNNLIRHPSHKMCAWAERWLNKLAAIRCQAILALAPPCPSSTH